MSSTMRNHVRILIHDERIIHRTGIGERQTSVEEVPGISSYGDSTSSMMNNVALIPDRGRLMPTLLLQRLPIIRILHIPYQCLGQADKECVPSDLYRVAILYITMARHISRMVVIAQQIFRR